MFVAGPNKHDILFDRSGAGKSNTFRSRKGYMVEAHDIHVGGNYIREEITSLSMLQLSLQLKGKVIGQKGSRCGNK